MPDKKIELEDAIANIEAIQQSVKEQVMSVEKDERSFVLGIISSAFAMASDDLRKYRAELEANGMASAMPEEKKIRLRKLLRSAVKKVS